jgi:hypothetical protein
MAKKKAKQSKARETILSMRGYPEWSQWLTELAEEARTTRAGAIDLALAQFAKRIGFRQPPPR